LVSQKDLIVDPALCYSVHNGKKRENIRKKRMKKIRANFKLWLTTLDGDGGFGDGKWRLLQEIDNRGSLQAACRHLEISYRNAWGDVNDAEEFFGIKLIDRRRGGPAGGTSGLTPQGKHIVDSYAVLHNEVEKSVKKLFRKYHETF
jgi:molybdate transport system regulatory protein